MEQKKRIDEDSVEKGESISTKLTRKSEEQMESVNSVFNIPLLMDKIVKYTIYSSNGKKPNKQNIIAVRLVNKLFLQSASRTLKKSGDWIIRLIIGRLYGSTTQNRAIFDKYKENVLNQFFSVFCNTFTSIDSILPIRLEIEKENQLKEHSTKLNDFFDRCSHTISSLHVTYPLDGGSMNLTLKNLNFPNLQSFYLRFTTWKDPTTNESQALVSQNNTNGLAFLQEILQNAKNLQQLTLINDDWETINFSCIRLPATIKRLELGSPLTGNELTLLTNNPLPKLNTLEWFMGRYEEEALMNKFLERFGKQLTKLVMSFMSSFKEDEEEEIEHRFCIKLPLMEKLKYLRVGGDDFELSPEQRRDIWPKLVPHLSQLIFDELTEPMFFDWVQGSQFDNAEKLKFSLYHIEQPFQKKLSPKVQIVQQIITSFPNIQKLSLKFLLDETSGLKFIFRNLTCLKKLRLDFEFQGLNRETLGYKFVSLFLGISLELATAIVDNPETNVTIPVDNPESIMNLIELNSLTLWAPIMYKDLESTEDVLCSRVISTFGLNKMTKLVKTKFLEGFQPIQPDPLAGLYDH